ncbi:IPT/TIG domain-containing protein [Frondihabitans sp. PhB188]|uniref:amidase domain-containing protein n=1 Tax=Frondihabitans sp. PhB188 TaxID=2485200 RepID=UPI000F48DDC8|nr:amidase domain-containing protein [Frondihabitans sp. PhB188]ROQ39830.1 IPT/TIG domain-containing protein [Frondihabitans sp. PhB188]
MRKRFVPVLTTAVVATALLAGCTSGTSGVMPPATLGEQTPLKSSTPAAPTASSLSATSGGLVGGSTVTISGTSLADVSAVKFGTVAATSVKATATSVTAVVPHAVDYQPSTVDVTVTGASSSGLSYDYKVTDGVDREMQYAFQHWSAKAYNASFANFNAVGGDCQNFVSQALAARGLAQNDSWYYNSTGHSESWGYAPSFDTYLATTPSLGFTRLAATERSKLAIGDLAYFDWNDNGVPDHVMIVSAIAGSKISLVGHNLDYDYRDLDTAITKDHPGADVWFYKVPASL